MRLMSRITLRSAGAAALALGAGLAHAHPGHGASGFVHAHTFDLEPLRAVTLAMLGLAGPFLVEIAAVGVALAAAILIGQRLRRGRSVAPRPTVR